ncbi:TetR/AcrR family transcriptional regulator [Agromyces mediolanus]|uniref:TetR/AcrR family transcriptional regulator n=1 Tax=Agromyces mediolanus TaxID=41986 RepID=UPI001E439BBC|nr:TetR/AcrR family transcriptional regulator [Agromyces mediolanus]MCD1570742.1 TetR/AcrR family transcriptional regulator [Agromyces mediolanus]
MPSRQEAPAARPVLSRRELAAAAIELIERDGLDALTMRRLASGLGFAPMSLYTHVRSRDDLIDAIVEQLIERLGLGDDDPVGTADWRELVRRTLGAYRDLAVALPRSFELLALAPYGTAPVAPHLLATIARLEAAGLDPEAAREILGIVDGYASGFLVVWARSRETAAAEADGVAALRDLAMFDRGIDAIIAGLDATLVRGGVGGRA